MSLADACGTDPSFVCEHVYDWTSNKPVAVAADWLVAKPLAVAAIIVAAIIVSRVARWLIKRSMARVMARSRAVSDPSWLREKTPDVLLRSTEWNLRAEARGQTLAAVFKSVASIIVWTVAVVWILEVLQIDLGPFVAGTAILGVALGFGAQNIVRDVLAGFFLVVEDQFGVGDIVDLGGEARGTVEKITLRSTSVRDVHGTAWHVANGQLQRVGNKSQEWARAVLDIEVGMDTDYESVQEVIKSVAGSTADDPAWRRDILESPEVWGIESFTPYGYVVRLVVKTRPASQFAVMRELRIRLKAGFDAAGIDLPNAQKQLWVNETVEQEHPSTPPSASTPAKTTSQQPRRGDPSEA